MKEDYIIGLDIGTNSVGWAVVSCVQKDGQWHPTDLIDLNSYIFQEVVEAKTQVPLNAVRRQKRLARRQVTRRARRRRELAAMLRQYGLLPDDKDGSPYISEEDANSIDKAFAERVTQNSQDIKKHKNPFAIRAIGLEQELKPHELGRAILHLQSHRGYRSNEGAKYVELLEMLAIGESLNDKEDGKESAADKQEKQKVLGGISKLEEEMKKAGLETVGQYVWHKVQNGEELNRITGYSIKEKKLKGDVEEEYNTALYARRDMTQKEFDLIWKKQEPVVGKSIKRMNISGSVEDAHAKIKKLLFEQYPVQSPPPPRHRQKHLSYNSAGKCTLEPKKSRCRAAWPEAQEFRTWQVINNLRMAGNYLPLDQKHKLFEAANDITKLNNDGRLSWTKVAECLGIKRKGLNYPDEGDLKSGLIGNRTKKNMADIIGNQDYTKYTEDLLTIVSKKALYERLVKLGLSAGKGGDALKLTMLDLETSYIKYSLKAIRNLLPHLRKGEDLHNAMVACGYKDKDEKPNINDGGNQLLTNSIPQVANPRVQKAAYATRRVVNAIIKRYGKRPAQINIEMARDLKANKEERANVTKRNKANRDANIKAIAELKNVGKQINHNNISKYKCWHYEQECQCAYCGKTMGLEEVFQDGRNQWEHILPQSEFKQNYMNRVLACWGCNMAKGGRTPYQAWGDTNRWKPIEDRMNDWKRIMPREKRRRILSKESIGDSENFCERALKDTQYITTIISEHFKQQNIKVQASRGMATSELRYRWGLNKILPIPENLTKAKDDDDKIKVRIDHRHHAVDAFVIALTSHKVLMHLTEYMQYDRDCKQGDSATIRENRKQKLVESLIPDTWRKSDMHNTVRAKLLSKNVAIQKKTKVQGSLHEETIYGRSCYTTNMEIPKKVAKAFIDRIGRILEHKPSNNGTVTTDGDIEWIGNPKLYEQVKSWYEENKDKPASKRPPLNVHKLPISHRCYTLKTEIEKAIKLVSSPEWLPSSSKRWIADEELHKVLYKWIEENNLIDATDKNIDSAIKASPPRMPTNTGNYGNLIKTVRVAMRCNAGKTQYIAGRGIVQLGNNHHIDIFFSENENKRRVRLTSAIEAALRQSRKQATINKDPDPTWGEGWQYQTTLCQGDLVTFNTDDLLIKEDLTSKIQQQMAELNATIYRVQNLSITEKGTPDVSFRLVSIASTDNDYGLIRIRAANNLAIKHVELGVLGS